MNTTAVQTAEEIFISLYNNDGRFSSLRMNALEAFRKEGFPTTRNEEYKYTSFNAALQNQYSFADQNVIAKQHLPSTGLTSNTVTFVFENGNFRADLSDSLSEKGCKVIPINSADENIVEKYLGDSGVKADIFSALNTALFTDGLFIHVEKNVKVEKTIRLINITSGVHSVANIIRNVIVAEQGAEVNIIEVQASEVNASSFTNSYTQIFAGKNSRVELTKLQTYNEQIAFVDQTNAIVEADANFHIHTVNLAKGLTRNNLNIVMNGRNANAWLNGLSIGKSKGHTDNHTFVDHAMPDCYSDELYKAILDENSKGVFNGKIFVRKDAQKTNAYQSNKNIILSDDASMTAKPQLEIYADDVKCSHGATTGQLDPEALFYLRSRGIGEHTAKAFLTVAFANDVLDRITNEQLREELKNKVYDTLADA